VPSNHSGGGGGGVAGARFGSTGGGGGGYGQKGADAEPNHFEGGNNPGGKGGNVYGTQDLVKLLPGSGGEMSC